MAKKIEWLDNFAEKYAKTINKTASKEKETLILDKEHFKNPKVGDVVRFKNKLYKIANAEYVDEVGPGVLLMEMGDTIPTTDPLSMAMGTEVTGVENLCNVEPEMARTNPGNVYDLEDVRQLEVEHAEEAARQTVEKINEENAVDRTTIPGHFSPEKNAETVVEETVVEDVLEELVDEVVEELVDEENLEVTAEDEEIEVVVAEEEFEEVIAKRSNRVLRRIMASKKNR